jgi:hypothetical protein
MYIRQGYFSLNADYDDRYTHTLVSVLMEFSCGDCSVHLLKLAAPEVKFV